VPFDFRHHTFKTKPRYPTQWYLTDERRKHLDESRQQREQLDAERRQQGRLISGLKTIKEAYAAAALPLDAMQAQEPEAVRMFQAAGVGGGGGSGGARRLGGFDRRKR
jgi:hypothetical protein